MHWYNRFIPGVTRPVGFLLAPSEATKCEQDFCSRSRLVATCEDPVEMPLYPQGSLLEALLLHGLASGLSTGQWGRVRVPIRGAVVFWCTGVSCLRQGKKKRDLHRPIWMCYVLHDNYGDLRKQAAEISELSQQYTGNTACKRDNSIP